MLRSGYLTRNIRSARGPKLFAMLRRITCFSAFSLGLLVAACSTTPRQTPLKAPAPPSQKSTTAPSEASPPRLSAGEYALTVESEPVGGIVVVDGVPVGRTPRRVVLTGTAHGFFRDQVSIKVRFVAVDSDHTSQTVEEILTPLDKIPASVRFTPNGATRVAR